MKYNIDKFASMFGYLGKAANRSDRDGFAFDKGSKFVAEEKGGHQIQFPEREISGYISTGVNAFMGSKGNVAPVDPPYIIEGGSYVPIE